MRRDIAKLYTCDRHKKYTAKNIPYCGCEKCWVLYIFYQISHANIYEAHIVGKKIAKLIARLYQRKV